MRSGLDDEIEFDLNRESNSSLKRRATTRAAAVAAFSAFNDITQHVIILI